MADAFGVDEIVSRFFIDTCPPRYLLNLQEMMALRMKTGLQHNYEFDVTLLTTGSAAELYIDPMLPCIDDVDLMYHSGDMLAIPEGYSPPVQLPAEFGSRVVVGLFEIIDSEFPGYVYLVLSYLLTKCTVDGKYFAIDCKRAYHGKRAFAGVGYRGENVTEHGPAVVIEWQLDNVMSLLFPKFADEGNQTSDNVQCVRCLLWPSQAADWPTRRRNSGWPDSATIDGVVNNGCDVVAVAHRLCRPDEWDSKTQWRLSFSRAEVVLLNSWTQVQQIVYHMLRVYLKSEQYVKRNDSQAKTLSNYHIKTIMLWACELKPRRWWNDDFNVVEICVKLLHVLGVWLRDARCKHHFISNCNLLNHLDKSGSHQLTAVKLTSVTVQSLSKWFVHNYIRKCAHRCDAQISSFLQRVRIARNAERCTS